MAMRTIMARASPCPPARMDFGLVISRKVIQAGFMPGSGKARDT